MTKNCGYFLQLVAVLRVCGQSNCDASGRVKAAWRKEGGDGERRILPEVPQESKPLCVPPAGEKERGYELLRKRRYELLKWRVYEILKKEGIRVTKKEEGIRVTREDGIQATKQEGRPPFSPSRI